LAAEIKHQIGGAGDSATTQKRPRGIDGDGVRRARPPRLTKHGFRGSVEAMNTMNEGT
jgi:hypothetical protein